MPIDSKIIAELISAVKKDQDDKVLEILNLNPGIRIDDQYEDKNTLLHFAANSNSGSTVAALLKRGANPFLLNKDNQTPYNLAKNVPDAQYNRVAGILKNHEGPAARRKIIEAFNKKNLDEAEKIASISPDWISYDINEKVPPGDKTLLCLACERNDIEWVKFLIQHGGKPNHYNAYPYGHCLINWAIQHGASDELIGYLVDAGANFDTPSEMYRYGKNKETSFIAAAKANRPELIKLFLKSRPQYDVNALGNDGKSALNIAVQNGYSEVIKNLCLSTRIDLNPRTAVDVTPLIAAILTGKNDIVIEVLKKISTFYPSPDGYSPLMFARQYGYADIVKTLSESIPNKETAEITAFNKAFHIIKEAGHTLGLEGSITVPLQHTPNIKFQVATAGYFTFDAIRILLENIVDYNKLIPNNIDKNVLQYFKEIEKAFSDEIDYLRFENPFMEIQKIYKKYSEDGLILVPCNWKGHSTTIAFYKDYMVVCDRGQGGVQSYGTQIYKIKNRNLVTSELITRISASGYNRRQQDVEPLYKAIVEPEPIVKLPSKGQKHGTCSFVNAKSAIEGILFVFERERLLRKDAAENLSSDKATYLAAAYAEGHYKKFTAFIRDRQVDKLIKGMNFQTENKSLYEALLALTMDKAFRLPYQKARPHDIARVYVKRENKIILELKRAMKIFLASDNQRQKNMVDRFITHHKEWFASFLSELVKHNQTEFFDMLVKDRNIKLEHGKVLFDQPSVAKKSADKPSDTKQKKETNETGQKEPKLKSESPNAATEDSDAKKNKGPKL